MRNKTLEQNSAQDLAGLQVDILQKLRNGNMSWEQIDWFKNLSFEKREELMGKSIKNIEHPKMKLQNSNIIVDTLLVSLGINPEQHFTENKKVKYYLGDNFKKYVLNGVKTINGLSQMNFSKHKFTDTIYDKEIMEHFQISESNGLMTQEQILWTIIFLTGKQPKGENGDLINDGNCTIIGYMLCSDGVVRAVDVYWRSGSSEWRCSCRGLDGWYAGLEVLSRNL
jgi:hypothetical protein